MFLICLAKMGYYIEKIERSRRERKKEKKKNKNRKVWQRFQIKKKKEE